MARFIAIALMLVLGQNLFAHTIDEKKCSDVLKSPRILVLPANDPRTPSEPTMDDALAALERGLKIAGTMVSARPTTTTVR